MLLGIDMGSGGVKLTVLSEDGGLLGEGGRDYPTHYPKVGWSEQSPAEWWDALVEALHDLISRKILVPEELSCISIDSATHTAVLLGEDMKPLRDAIFWTDQRSAAEVKYLTDSFGERIAGKTLHQPGTIWTLPQLLWLKNHEPEVFGKLRALLFEKDYIRLLLTGEAMTDNIEACGSMLYDYGETRWDEWLCGLCGIDPRALPKLVKPLDTAGYVTKAAAGATGLREGTRVLCGTTDTVMEIFGAGAVKTGQATVKLATAGRICVVSDRCVPDSCLINYPHVADGLWYPGTATRSAASAFRWYRDTFWHGNIDYKTLDGDAEKIPIGCEGLFFSPYLMGELAPYNDSNLRASFVGATMKHTGAHFTRSVLEGVAFSLRDTLGVLTRRGLAVGEASLIGGGAKSRLWSQITSDVLGIPLRLPRRSDSSFASAMLAGVGSGAFGSLEDAVRRCVKFDGEVLPDEAAHEKYDEYFQIYRQIHDALSDVYGRLALLS